MRRELTYLIEQPTLLNSLSDSELRELSGLLEEVDRNTPLWRPRKGNIPQRMGYESEADELYYGGAAGGGKALSLDTSLPSPHGWIPMRSIKVGDELFDENGKPCRVLAVSKIMRDRKCFELEFDDGERIVADAGHLWRTLTDKDRVKELRSSGAWRKRRRRKRLKRGTGKRPDLAKRNAARKTPYCEITGDVRTTLDIFETSHVGKSNRVNHSIPIAGCLNLPCADLSIPPYVLGVWLGDGNSRHGRIYIDHPDREIVRRVRCMGFETSYIPSDRIGWTILGLKAKLRELGLLTNKHIPIEYLRASKSQRLDLLAGLMDTDGNCCEDGGAEFTNTNHALALGTLELIRSLGIKATITEGRAIIYGRDCGPKWRVKVTTTVPIFKLARKLERQKSKCRSTQRQRYIVNCRPVSSVPVRCIQVDSPSHLFLAGRGMVSTHNSDLLLGLALTRHRKSIIFRREEVQLKGAGGLLERSRQIIGKEGKFNANDKFWRLNDGRMLAFGSIKEPDDWMKYQGRAHDLLAFDELPHFTNDQYRNLVAWNRSVLQGQRIRVVGAGNPPLNADQRWVIKEWAPWLDEEFPYKAEPGELRWFFVDPDTDATQWLENAKPVKVGKRTIKPTSRTFIPASITDNPDLVATDYESKLASLPEPYRSILFGSFKKGIQDGSYQVVPTAWIQEAFRRYHAIAKEYERKPLQCLGCDPVWGGKDEFSLCPRKGFWWGKIKTHPGHSVTSGAIGAQYCWDDFLKHEPNPHVIQVNVDVIGYGSTTYEACCRMKIAAIPIDVSLATEARDRNNNFGFKNLRAFGYWGVRELLDPENGFRPAICPDNELLQELSAHHWIPRPGGIIQIEDKKEIKKRIGRSPDRAESFMLSTLHGDPSMRGESTVHHMG